MVITLARPTSYLSLCPPPALPLFSSHMGFCQTQGPHGTPQPLGKPSRLHARSPLWPAQVAASREWWSGLLIVGTSRGSGVP